MFKEKTREQIEQELSVYYGKGFSDDQILELRAGIERDLNVQFYADKNISAKQMRKMWQELYASKTEYEQKEQEAAALLAKAEKANEDLKIAANKQHRRESAIIAIVLAIISIIFCIMRILYIIK